MKGPFLGLTRKSKYKATKICPQTSLLTDRPEMRSNMALYTNIDGSNSNRNFDNSVLTDIRGVSYWMVSSKYSPCNTEFEERFCSQWGNTGTLKTEDQIWVVSTAAKDNGT